MIDRVFTAVERLRDFPAAGRRLPELPHGPYRELIIPPLRVIYRAASPAIHIVHVTRGERPLRPHRLR
jgi:plasmid stabilization system protein ParE